MQVQPYLNFDGRCEEALEFYKTALGAKVGMMMRFKEAPDPAMQPPEGGDKILHAAFTVGDSVIMASDGRCTGKGTNFHGFSLAIGAADDVEAERMFHSLSDGGRVDMPLTKTFFASKFGMVVDRFGLCWMVMAAAGAPAGA